VKCTQFSSVGALVLATLFLVSTITNWESDVNSVAGATTLTITSSVPNSGLTINKDARVVVLGSDGKPVDPQPTLKIDPNTGTQAASHTIEILGGTFPEGAKIRITSIDTLDGTPVGSWGS